MVYTIFYYIGYSLPYLLALAILFGIGVLIYKGIKKIIS